MNAHSFCRKLLKTSLAEIQVKNERGLRRQIKLDVSSSMFHDDYFVEIIDSLDPGTGTQFPGPNAPGHFRRCSYSVSGACCKYAAKLEALYTHAETFS